MENETYYKKISVTERLPIEAKEYIFLHENGSGSSYDYDSTFEMVGDGTKSICIIHTTLTHWLEPLPASQFIPQERKEEEIGLLAKEKNIVCWMVPATFSDRVEWGYEMEIIPYTKIEAFYKNNQGNGVEGNHVYSYKEWKTYDEAFREMILHANSLYHLYQSQKQK